MTTAAPFQLWKAHARLALVGVQTRTFRLELPVDRAGIVISEDVANDTTIRGIAFCIDPDAA
jgi:hypothetical protein